jgi:hypothetical protein
LNAGNNAVIYKAKKIGKCNKLIFNVLKQIARYNSACGVDKTNI